jgi:guanylate kinase
MRREPTRAEVLLWSRLRRRQIGVRFRRQEPIGPYIVDFAALSVGVVVEVDGETHDDPAADEQRDRYLRSKGMQVFRFYNTDVLEDLDGVVTVISEAVIRRSGAGQSAE